MENIVETKITQKSFNPFPFLLLLMLMFLVVVNSVNSSALTIDDIFGNSKYLIHNKNIINNAPSWNNEDFPTKFIFYNLEDNHYYLTTSPSCCGYKHNGYINTLTEVFVLGDKSFRLYKYDGTEWVNLPNIESIDLSIFKLVDYDSSISKLYIDNKLVLSFMECLNGLFDMITTITFNIFRIIPLVIIFGASMIILVTKAFIKIKEVS